MLSGLEKNTSQVDPKLVSQLAKAGIKYEDPYRNVGNSDRSVRLINRKTKNGTPVFIGALVTTKQGGQVFLERPKQMSIEETVTAIRKLLASLQTIHIENGTVTGIISGSRERISALGVYKPLIDTPPQPETFEVQPVRQSKRRIATAINKDDSFGKEQWRRAIMDMMKEIYPRGYKTILRDERRVLCFPGIGKEAKMWQQYGFRNEEMVFIERDRAIAEKLEQNFPGAMVMCREFGASGLSDDEIILDLAHLVNEACRDNKPGSKFSIVNIDPENSLTPSMGAAIQWLLRMLPISDHAFLGLNFACKREQSTAYYESLIGCKQGNFEGTLDDLRREALKKLIPDIIRSKGVKESRYGDYEGDTGTSRMYFAMHHLKRVY